jgi:hypothetical protein
MARRKGSRRIVNQGRRYWSNRGTSRGKRSGIAWGTHGKAGGFYQCVARVSPHLGKGAKGYCALRAHEATGQWPGRRGRKRR